MHMHTHTHTHLLLPPTNTYACYVLPAGNAVATAHIEAATYSAATSIARLQLRALIEVTGGCSSGVTISLDTFAKALADASAHAFVSIRSKNCTPAEASTTAYQQAYSSFMSHQDLYMKVVDSCLSCCPK